VRPPGARPNNSSPGEASDCGWHPRAVLHASPTRLDKWHPRGRRSRKRGKGWLTAETTGSTGAPSTRSSGVEATTRRSSPYSSVPASSSCSAQGERIAPQNVPRVVALAVMGFNVATIIGCLLVPWLGETWGRRKLGASWERWGSRGRPAHRRTPEHGARRRRHGMGLLTGAVSHPLARETRRSPMPQ